MADVALTLPPALDAFVEDQVRSGAYRDRQALITDAVEQLRDRAATDETDDAKLARLNARLQKAIDSLDRGEGIEITDITAHFDEIEAEVEAEFTQHRR
ncbi:ribbon-helix-helix domain-containing protein [Brevundimonas sp.]|uniref:ribbon-helix-helix domain-containing protein n=1 Tax=Brevundimonas sp. TaxID=1871086 RepID=UPI003A8D5A36